MDMFQTVLGIGVALTVALLIIRYVAIPEWNANMRMRREFRAFRKHKNESEIFGVPPAVSWWQLEDLGCDGKLATQYRWWYVQSTSIAAARLAVLRYMRDNLTVNGSATSWKAIMITGCLVKGIALSAKRPDVKIVIDDRMEA